MIVYGITAEQAVALLAEGVDRNQTQKGASHEEEQVALLAEGVDRNTFAAQKRSSEWVALLAEGVDRNFTRS